MQGRHRTGSPLGIEGLEREKGAQTGRNGLLPREQGAQARPCTLLPGEYGAPVRPRRLLPREYGAPERSRTLLPGEQGDSVRPSALLPRENGIPARWRSVFPREYGEASRRAANFPQKRLKSPRPHAGSPPIGRKTTSPRGKDRPQPLDRADRQASRRRIAQNTIIIILFCCLLGRAQKNARTFASPSQGALLRVRKIFPDFRGPDCPVPNRESETGSTVHGPLRAALAPQLQAQQVQQERV